jgi:HSP20 family molecular chaperone IbpA
MAQAMTTSPTRDLSPGTQGESTRSAPVFVPNTDIYETEDHIVLVADMPGVAPHDVDVNLERRVLTVRGRVPVQAPEGYRRVHSEYGVGDFERVFTLSEEIDRDHIEASHENGVLTLKMPKAESAKTRKIEVKAV